VNRICARSLANNDRRSRRLAGVRKEDHAYEADSLYLGTPSSAVPTVPKYRFANTLRFSLRPVKGRSGKAGFPRSAYCELLAAVRLLGVTA
jgi:hypothetical protein